MKQMIKEEISFILNEKINKKCWIYFIKKFIFETTKVKKKFIQNNFLSNLINLEFENIFYFIFRIDIKIYGRIFFLFAR